MIDKILGESNVLVTYFKRLNKCGQNWLPTDEQQVTSRDQILLENIPVQYACTQRIKCTIDKTIASKVDDLLKLQQ